MSTELRHGGQVTSSKEMATSVSTMLTKYAPQIELSVPGAAAGLLKPERIIRLLLNEAGRIPALLQCTPASLVGAMLTSAALGLEIGAHLGHGYILPFKGVATFVPGYKGLVALAYRSQQIASLHAHVVYQHDDFRVELGTEPSIHHVPAIDRDPGPARYYYAVAKLTTGGVVFNRPMTVADVQKVMRASPSSKRSGGPWQTHFDEMALKTCIRRIAKVLPASSELAQAVAIDDAVEGGKRPIVPPELDWLPSEATGTGGEDITDGETVEEPQS